jgi:hypothetical protein
VIKAAKTRARTHTHSPVAMVKRSAVDGPTYRSSYAAASPRQQDTKGICNHPSPLFNRNSIKTAPYVVSSHLGFESRRGLGIFLFTTASRTALGTTQPPIQWVPGALSLGVKRPGREVDNSLPSNAKIKNAWSYTSTPQYVFMAWCLVKQRDSFTFLPFTYPFWIGTSGGFLWTR